MPNMKTIAIEFVPPETKEGPDKAVEDARRMVQLAEERGMRQRIGHVMIPGMIEEDPDRPVEMAPRMDPLDVWNAIRPEVPGTSGLCTQVTAFMDEPQLTERLQTLRQAGMDGVIFVGVPRTMADGEGSGVPPTDALSMYTELVPNRGVILIPTREGEQGRFNFKCESGAAFGMTQLLYSTAIVDFLKNFAEATPHRPEILLSFGYIPGVEQRMGLIRWLIQDPGNPVVETEQEYVAKLAERSVQERRTELVDLYKRVLDGVHDLGFPLSIHFEAPYGFVGSAFDMFAEMLEYWSPDRQRNSAPPTDVSK